MTLKTIADKLVRAAESLPIEETVASPRPLATPPPSAPPATQPFESFVRSIVATQQAAPAPRSLPASTPAEEEVIAQTEVDGVRYVILRYELSSRESNVNLSPREREIVCLIAKGFPNKAIADALEISTWTVGTHLRRIFAKMGVTSRAAMVAKHLQLNPSGRSPRITRSPPAR